MYPCPRILPAPGIPVEPIFSCLFTRICGSISFRKTGNGYIEKVYENATEFFFAFYAFFLTAEASERRLVRGEISYRGEDDGLSCTNSPAAAPKTEKRTMSDEEIVRLIKSENEEDVRSGMERLIDAYGGRIDATVWRHSQALDPHSREDIRQDVLLKIGKKIKDNYRHEGKLWAYIETVIRGMSIDTYRQKKRRTERTPLGEDLVSKDQSPPEPKTRVQDQPDERLIREERIRAVRNALTNIKKECQEIINLHYAQELKYKEIAKKLNISSGTVGSRLARCLEQLGKALPDEIILME